MLNAKLHAVSCFNERVKNRANFSNDENDTLTANNNCGNNI